MSRRSLVSFLVLATFGLWFQSLAWGEEVPYTLEDRDRLIRVETTLRELKEQTDSRFTEAQTSTDTRFTEFQKSIDTRFTEFQKSIDTRFTEFQKSIDTRFAEFQKSSDTRFAEFQQSIDTRFVEFQKSVDDRFGQLMNFLGIICAVFGGLVAVTIGFAVWDRRTALAPAMRKNEETRERQARLEQAFRELAQDDPKIAQVLRHVGLL